MTSTKPALRLLDNPFFVLELAPDCSRAEVERAGQKILAMLEVGLAGADRYATPLGSSAHRDAAKVREAMAELRDPQRRLFHELWVQQGKDAGAGPVTGRLAAVDEDDELGFHAARSALGWC